LVLLHLTYWLIGYGGELCIWQFFSRYSNADMGGFFSMMFAMAASVLCAIPSFGRTIEET
jgi:hypothetical protein